MSDFVKFIACVVFVAGAWFVKDMRMGWGRQLSADSTSGLTMLTGQTPVQGRPVILEFWGTYCPPCVASIPHLNQLHTKFGSRVQFLAVSGENPQVVKNFMKNHAMSYPVAVDSTHKLFDAWSITGVPTLIYLDKNHKEKWRGHSMQMTDALLGSLVAK